jgi:hypothetical protein
MFLFRLSVLLTFLLVIKTTNIQLKDTLRKIEKNNILSRVGVSL